MGPRFFQYQLRTTDVDAARVFYRAVLGEVPIRALPLHEQALARGARPHWLGYLGAQALDPLVEAFTARGASTLGLKGKDAAGVEVAVMRDPGGAVLALAQAPLEADARHDAVAPQVAWHVLNTRDLARAMENYAECFGWAFEAPVEITGHGRFYPFSWRRGEPLVGAMADVAGRPRVHPHWLFHMRVRDLDEALDAVRAGRGSVVETTTLPAGTSWGSAVAVCEDPVGAAFALVS